VNGRFVISAEAERETLTWGTLGWMCRPAATGAKDLVVIEVTLLPGHGHNFHRHPDQEEAIYVLEGEVEQWLERERRALRPGDAVFIGAGVVHASFNVTAAPARLLAILGPAVGEGGYVSVEVGGDAPWRDLRG
jgi:quercetin dioxygenase-like cupin family protein